MLQQDAAINQAVDIDSVFTALADTRRRQLLEHLAQTGPRSASQLAEQWDISRQAIAKHLNILQKANLVQRQRSGREIRYAVNAKQLSATGRWLTRAAARWEEQAV